MHPRKPRSQFRSSRVRRSCTLVRCRQAIETFAAAAPLPAIVLDRFANDCDSSPPHTGRLQLRLFARATKPYVDDSAQLEFAPIAIALSRSPRARLCSRSLRVPSPGQTLMPFARSVRTRANPCYPFRCDPPSGRTSNPSASPAVTRVQLSGRWR